MRSITVYFNNGDFDKLEEMKDESGKSWRDFILDLARVKDSE